MEISRRFLLCFFILLHPLLCVLSKFVWGHLFVKHSQTCLSYFIDKKNVLQKHSGWKIYLIRGNPSFWIVSFKCTPFLTSSKRSVCYNGYSFLGGVNEWQKEVYFRQKDNRNTSNISKLENAAIYVLFTRMFIFSSFVRKLCVPILWTWTFRVKGGGSDAFSKVLSLNCPLAKRFILMWNPFWRKKPDATNHVLPFNAHRVKYNCVRHFFPPKNKVERDKNWSQKSSRY